MGMPEILINFTQKAASAIARSERGIVCMVIRDTAETASVATYKNVADVDAADYTADNYTAIRNAFYDGPNKVCVIKMPKNGAWTDAKPIVDALKFNYLCSTIQTDQQAIVDYIKARNKADRNRPVKAVIHNIAADDEHIINFANVSVTTVDDIVIPGLNYLPRIAGLLAAMPFTRSATYYKFKDLKTVEEVGDLETIGKAVDDGKFVIFADYGEPKVASGVNSLTTTGPNGKTNDMKKIAIVEAMDMIQEDIAEEFRTNYIGRYKNDLDNQMLFVSAVNQYFIKLTTEQVLDKNYDNAAGIDIEAQRAAWIDNGTTEAEDWDDTKIKNMAYKNHMFLAGNVKILDAIENLQFGITMA